MIALSNNQDINSNIKFVASGYRLPSYPSLGHCHDWWQLQEVLAMGRRVFSGLGWCGTEYDKVTMWQKYRVSIDIAPEFNAPSKASDRQPNGFDLYDMLGNLAEWVEHVTSIMTE